MALIFLVSSRLLTMSNVSTLRKRRGVVRASITRLTNRLKELEGDTDSPVTLDLAGGMTRKLDALDTEFRAHHQALVDLIDDEEALLTEQNTLDDHDDHVAVLTARIRQLVSACTPSSDLSLRKIASRRLSPTEISVLCQNGNHNVWRGTFGCLSPASVRGTTQRL